VLCLSLVVLAMDNTILNVALPTLARDLGATGSELQWMVDAYLYGVRRAAAHHGGRRRPVRPQAGPQRRSAGVRGGLGRVGVCRLPGGPDHRPGGHGDRRRPDHARDLVHHHQHLPAHRARPGHRGVGRRGGAGRGAGARGRRLAPGAGVPRPQRHAAGPDRGGAVGRGPGRVGLRDHPGPRGRVDRPGDPGRLRGHRRRSVGGVRLVGAAQPAPDAADGALPQPPLQRRQRRWPSRRRWPRGLSSASAPSWWWSPAC
jgi:hypothetical protein